MFGGHFTGEKLTTYHPPSYLVKCILEPLFFGFIRNEPFLNFNFRSVCAVFSSDFHSNWMPRNVNTLHYSCCDPYTHLSKLSESI